MYVVYVLPLQQSKFYVGKTKECNFEARMQQHQDGQGHGGAAFTSRFKPIRQPEIKSRHPDEQSASAAELQTTLELMRQKGIDSVRGAQWSRVEMTPAMKADIQSQIDHTYDQCYKCHQTGHSAAQCLVAAALPPAAAPRAPAASAMQQFAPRCFRCHRSSHVMQDCSASTDAEGRQLPQGVHRCCFRCGRTSHYANDCFAKRDMFGNQL